MRLLGMGLGTVLLAFTLLGGGCGPGASHPDREKRITVAATIFPLADITQNIGGDLVETVTLLPAGASPHTFEPTPAQMSKVAQADLLVRVGAGLDDWVAGLVAANSRAVHVTAVDAVGGNVLPCVPEAEVAPHPDEPEASNRTDEHAPESSPAAPVDPHVWLDPVLVRERIAPAIAAALCQVAPEHRQWFAQNLARYQQKLTSLDAEIRTQLAGLEGASFVTLHGAWQYFGKRYHLGQLLPVHYSPAREPSARWIAELITAARQTGAKAVLAEPQLSPKAVAVIAQESRLPILVLDPLGGPGVAGRDSYLAMMRYNARTLAKLTVQKPAEAVSR